MNATLKYAENQIIESIGKVVCDEVRNLFSNNSDEYSKIMTDKFNETLNSEKIKSDLEYNIDNLFKETFEEYKRKINDPNEDLNKDIYGRITELRNPKNAKETNQTNPVVFEKPVQKEENKEIKHMVDTKEEPLENSSQQNTTTENNSSGFFNKIKEIATPENIEKAQSLLNASDEDKQKILGNVLKMGMKKMGAENIEKAQSLFNASDEDKKKILGNVLKNGMNKIGAGSSSGKRDKKRKTEKKRKIQKTNVQRTKRKTEKFTGK